MIKRKLVELLTEKTCSDVDSLTACDATSTSRKDRILVDLSSMCQLVDHENDRCSDGANGVKSNFK